MTTKIGLLTQNNRNTGKGKYPVMPDIIKACLLVPKSWSYTFNASDSDATISAGIITNLLALGVNNAYSARSQFIGPFEALTDKTTDPTFQTYGFGRQVLTDQGKYIFDYELLDGGIEYFQAVMSFLGKTDLYNFVFLGHSGMVYTANIYDANGYVTGCKGITPAQIDPQKWKLANKDKAAQFMITLALQYVDEFNKDLCIIATGAELITTLKDNAVQDVVLTSTGTGSAGVYTMTVTTADGRINLGVGDASIALTAACFKCLRQSTGATITITSIAKVGQNIAVTVDTSDPDYTLHAPAVFSFQSVSSVFAIVAGYYETQVGGLVMAD